MTIQPARASYEGIVSAMVIARRALDDLPHTPFLAAGINLRFHSDGLVTALEEITANSWDERLGDEQLTIQERSVTRTIRWKEGRVNVTVTQKENQTFTLELNFDLQSNSVELLKKWLAVPVHSLREDAERILYKLLGFNAMR